MPNISSPNATANGKFAPAYPIKREALQAAIDFAERDGQARREAQVRVQSEDRLFRPAWTYGRDPFPITRASADSKPMAGSAAKSG